MVALFFAASGNRTLDASLFVLHPREMNRGTNNDPTLVPVTSQPAKNLFQGAFDDRITETKTVAVLSHELDTRMLTQQGAFTLHGSPKDLREIDNVESLIRAGIDSSGESSPASVFRNPTYSGFPLSREEARAIADKHALKPDLLHEQWDQIQRYAAATEVPDLADPAPQSHGRH